MPCRGRLSQPSNGSGLAAWALRLRFGQLVREGLLPREQQSLRQIRHHPFFGDERVAETTDHHLAPDHGLARGRKALEGSLVCSAHRSLPAHGIGRRQKELHLDRQVGKSAAIQLDDGSNQLRPTAQVLVRNVNEVVRGEVLADRLELAVAEERGGGTQDLRFEVLGHGG